MSNKSSIKTTEEILNDNDFKSLHSQKNSISIILTILELVLYFGFIALIAFNREFPFPKNLRGHNDRNSHSSRCHTTLVDFDRDLYPLGQYQI
jgi:hypothetical protein